MATSNPVRRIAAIVDAVALARGWITLAEIANHVRLPLSTVHRTASILVDVGYLAHDPSDKTYQIGDRLKRALLLTFGTGSLEELVRPTLIDLAERFTETAYAVSYTPSGPKLVDFYLPTLGSRTLVHPGFEFPMHATSVGKAILASLSEDQVRGEIEKGLESFMPNTITEESALHAELARIRKQGYAINDVELDPGIYAIGVTLIVNDDAVIGALGIAGIRDRMLKHNTEEQISESIMEAARNLSPMLLKACYKTDAGPESG